MRILLAVDGSSHSRRAIDLTASIPWPTGSTLRIIVVDEAEKELERYPWLGEPLIERRGPSWPHTRELAALATATQRRLIRDGLTVETAIPHGWAAAEIVREAREQPADLIVLGSRGHGVVGTALLGSVSAEVVDHAPCAVLVARTDTARHVVIGVDGSPESDAAIDFIADNGLFPEAWVDIVGAVRVLLPMSALTAVPTDAVASWADIIEEARRGIDVAARAAARRLGGADRRLTITVRDGHPASVLLDEAATLGAELIAVGTHGRTGVDRALRGSVSHHVLLHAHCSVLVYRPAVAVTAVSPGRTPERTIIHA